MEARTRPASTACFFGIALLAVLGTGQRLPAAEPLRPGDSTVRFGGVRPAVHNPNPNVSYDLDPAQERFFLHVPPGYTGREAYGLIVWVDHDEAIEQLPEGWGPVLAQRKLLFAAAQRSGNDQPTNRRLGLAVLGALEVMQRANIDPRRVYAAGLSGGARIAGFLGFFQNDLFSGTLQSCGADFHRAVPQVVAPPELEGMGGPYGVFKATAAEIYRARKSVKFALITGSRDFRHGNIVDIYNGGFARDGWKARLFDVPGMEHAPASPKTLEAALGFLDSR
jgi:hypothetical protein